MRPWRLRSHMGCPNAGPSGPSGHLEDLECFMRGKPAYERIDRDVARRYELISRIGRGPGPRDHSDGASRGAMAWSSR